VTRTVAARMAMYCKDSITNLMTEILSRREIAKIADRIAKSIFAE